MVGQIVPCPKTVSETGYILIVGDDTNSGSHHSIKRWDYMAVSYDPIKRVRYGGGFEVSRKEMEEWNS